MAKMVYDEWYGTLSYAQRAAYRKYNVSPAEHTDLIEHFGEGNHARITAYVKSRAVDGMYRAPWLGQWNLMPCPSCTRDVSAPVGARSFSCPFCDAVVTVP